LDKTYYQTVKGMVGPVNILEPGGNLIIVSECSEGLGSEEYATAQERLIGLGAEGFYADIRQKSHADIDEWQTQMQLKPMRAGTVHLYAGNLSAADKALTGVRQVESVDATLRRCVEQSGDPCVAVIPEGPYVVPVFQAA
jgi:nickel-dependent lactate racemase